ncbi:mediator of RNA polymerase II transcription subunit 30-like isoform X3 [Lampris incognitus]|uniref:mediator of RNA polymerase II transcription subunit 30-like isoform X3 n=1 Tax=Lampris incognitus TaxID=2546036 RepID=UPI0024B4D27C|nr:mediator of RNA polymerase II transcription subunit 30-like isoform X3 [Lampris incognitus]
MSAPLPQKGLAAMPSQQQPHMPTGASQGPGHPTMPPQGALREISPVFLCRIGQETVQDIVTRTMEIFQITRATQLPNGVTQSQAMYQDRFGKLQEHLRQLALLFRKLRLLYERCVEMTSDLQEGPAEGKTFLDPICPCPVSTADSLCRRGVTACQSGPLQCCCQPGETRNS